MFVSARDSACSAAGAPKSSWNKPLRFWPLVPGCSAFGDAQTELSLPSSLLPVPRRLSLQALLRRGRLARARSPPWPEGTHLARAWRRTSAWGQRLSGRWVADCYVTDSAHSVVREIDSTGSETVVAGYGGQGYSGDGGPATSAELDDPLGVAVDASGNLLVADEGNNRVRLVAATSGTFYGVAMTAGDIYTVAGDGTGGYSGAEAGHFGRAQ